MAEKIWSGIADTIDELGFDRKKLKERTLQWKIFVARANEDDVEVYKAFNVKEDALYSVFIALRDGFTSPTRKGAVPKPIKKGEYLILPFDGEEEEED